MSDHQDKLFDSGNLDVLIDILDLHPQFGCRRLKHHGIHTIRQLVDRTADDLIDDGFGFHSLMEIRNALDENGLKLKGDL